MIKKLLKANTNLTDKEIEKHIEDGVIVYSSFEEFESNWIAGLNDKEDALDGWNKLDKMELDGKEYRVDFAL